MAIPAAACPVRSTPAKTIALDHTNLVIAETLFGNCYAKNVEDKTFTVDETKALISFFETTVEC